MSFWCNLVLILNAFMWCISCCHSSHSCTCIAASPLGMLDEPREGCKDDVESNHKTLLVDKSWRWCVDGPILKMEGLSKCLDRRCSPSECHLTNTNLVLDPKQALEHSKPPMFLQIWLESFMYDALGCKSWLEPLDAYIFPCPKIYLEPYVGLWSNICLAMLRPIEVGCFPIIGEI